MAIEVWDIVLIPLICLKIVFNSLYAWFARSQRQLRFLLKPKFLWILAFFVGVVIIYGEFYFSTRLSIIEDEIVVGIPTQKPLTSITSEVDSNDQTDNQLSKKIATFAQGNFQFLNLVVKICIENTIVITFASITTIEFTTNLIHSFINCGLSNYLAISLDSESEQYLKKSNIQYIEPQLSHLVSKFRI